MSATLQRDCLLARRKAEPAAHQPMLRLLADENFDHDVVGVLRRRPTLDIIRVQAAGLSETDDADILAWAAVETRIVLSHDVNTMTKFATERLTRSDSMAGLFIVHQEGIALSKVIDDLLLMDDCSETTEWVGQILYLPLR